jgi:hypothetical protein
MNGNSMLDRTYFSAPRFCMEQSVGDFSDLDFELRADEDYQHQ